MQLLYRLANHFTYSHCFIGWSSHNCFILSNLLLLFLNLSGSEAMYNFFGIWIKNVSSIFISLQSTLLPGFNPYEKPMQFLSHHYNYINVLVTPNKTIQQSSMQSFIEDASTRFLYYLHYYHQCILPNKLNWNYETFVTFFLLQFIVVDKLKLLLIIQKLSLLC